MPASTARPPKARGAHWPDRVAHRHRRRAHKVFFAVAVLLLVLPWFAYRHVRGLVLGDEAVDAAPAVITAAAKPEATPAAAARTRSATPLAAATPAPPVSGETRARLAAVREGVMAGDDAKVSENVEALDQAARHAMRLADRGSAVHRIEARTLVQEMSGVRAAGWIDPFNMLVVVSGTGLRSRSTIDAVCERLARAGNVSEIVVSVQDGTASSPARSGIIDGACHPSASSPRGNRHIAGAASGVSGDDPAMDPARTARRAESMRILEESTPELPAEIPFAPTVDAPIYLRLDPPPEPEPRKEPSPAR